jgi:anti-anti-sigma factor
MDITTSRAGTVCIIHLSGLFEYPDEAKLVNTVQAAIESAPSTIGIDMLRIDTINSSGIATLITTLKLADEAKIDFLLFGMNAKVLLLLEKVFARDFVPLLTEEEFNARYL